MPGTGPFQLEKYTPKVGASFVRNPHYWGAPALPDRVEVTFYDDYQPQVLALQAGEIDMIQQIPVFEAVGLLNDPSVNIVSTPSAAQQQLYMRMDMEQCKEKRGVGSRACCLGWPRLGE